LRAPQARDIIPDVAGLCGLAQQVSDDVREVLLRLGDVLTSMQKPSRHTASSDPGGQVPSSSVMEEYALPEVGRG
jgi:hypothetical protein